MLFIFDDVIGDIKKNENNSKQTQLVLNRRHLVHNGTVSLCIVTQKYTLIPARLRSNASWLVLFKLNPNDFESVYGDAITLSKQNWRMLLEAVFGKHLDQIDSDGSDQEEEKEKAMRKRDEKATTKKKTSAKKHD